MSDKRIHIRYGSEEGLSIFKLEPLTPSTNLSAFKCPVDEYNDWLLLDALRSQSDHIARTWLLRERSAGAIAAYMSLIMDAIKLSATEKELHNLNYPFKTIPAMKVAKLAVDAEASARYKGLGTFMIEAAAGKALACNDEYCAARFLTADADVEHNAGVRVFYERNGFVPNAGRALKNRMTISMRKDIYR